MAAEAKTKADGLFRDRKFTDAIDAYGEAIDLDPSNKALYSNRAACQEKLLANLFGDEKKAKIEEGLEDARKCVALDAAWARGHQRRAAFCDLMVRSEIQQVSQNDDYVVDRSSADFSSDRNDQLERSASAQLCVKELRKEGEMACRQGLKLDASNEALRLHLLTLRDAADYVLDTTLEPTDAALVDATSAASAKKVGSGSFAAKDYKNAAAAFTKALAFDATDPVFYSNRSACRAALFEHRAALKDADACILLKPAWAKGQNRRATALYGLGRYGEAEQACDAGLQLEPGNAALATLKKTCAVETCEPLPVQAQMHKFREEKRSNAKMQEMLKGLNLGGQGAQVFSGSSFMNGMGGMNFGGGGGGTGMANMNEGQMRQMARAMANGEHADVPPPAPVVESDDDSVDEVTY